MLLSAKYKMKPPMSARLMPGHPLAEGLVGFWPFLRKSSTQVFDLSGKGNTGTLYGDVSWVAGKFGTALDFPGTVDYVKTGVTTQFADFTIVIWFNSDTVGDGYDRIIDKKYDTGTWMGRDASNENSFGGGVLKSDAPYGLYVTLSENEWHQLASVRQGTTHTIYGDGGSVSTSGTVSATLLDTSELVFGIKTDILGNEYDGQLDHVLLYNRALSASEIAQLYREPFCMFDWEWLPARVAANGDVLVTPDPASAVAASMDWLGISSAHLDSFCGEEVGATIGDALGGTDYWAHIATETHWFILDLDPDEEGITYNVQKIKGRSETTADPTVVNIYVSDNKENWGATVASGIDTLQDTSEWVEVDTTNKNGRYVKVEITDTEDVSDWLYFGHSDPSFTIFDVSVSVEPTVVIGGMTISTTPASAVAATVAPTVEYGSLTIEPAEASVIVTTVAPTVEYGSLTIEPAPASAIAAAIDPTVESGLLNITPSPAYAIAAKVDPTVVLGSITIEPTPAAAVAVSIGPYFADEGNAIFFGCNF